MLLCGKKYIQLSLINILIFTRLTHRLYTNSNDLLTYRDDLLTKEDDLLT